MDNIVYKVQKLNTNLNRLTASQSIIKDNIKALNSLNIQ